MSEVEIMEAPYESLQNHAPSSDIVPAIATILDYYVDKSCNIGDRKKYGDAEPLESISDVKQEDYNDHSFLVDVFGSDKGNNVAFYLEDMSANNDMKSEEAPETLVVCGIIK